MIDPPFGGGGDPGPLSVGGEDMALVGSNEGRTATFLDRWPLCEGRYSQTTPSAVQLLHLPRGVSKSHRIFL